MNIIAQRVTCLSLLLDHRNIRQQHHWIIGLFNASSDTWLISVLHFLGPFPAHAHSNRYISHRPRNNNNDNKNYWHAHTRHPRTHSHSIGCHTERHRPHNTTTVGLEICSNAVSSPPPPHTHLNYTLYFSHSKKYIVCLVHHRHSLALSSPPPLIQAFALCGDKVSTPKSIKGPQKQCSAPDTTPQKTALLLFGHLCLLLIFYLVEIRYKIWLFSF